MGWELCAGPRAARGQGDMDMAGDTVALGEIVITVPHCAG